MPKIAVLGGGAAGLAGAISAARNCPEAAIVVFEKMDEPARKILATGNGRCNLSNRNADISCYHGDEQVLSQVLRQFDADQCVQFFHSLGLLVREEEGRLYPYTLSASTVRDVLLHECERLGVRIETDTQVVSLERTEKGFLINELFFADKVLFALGGKAAAPLGTDGDGYRILKSLGIRYRSISPALVQLKTGGKQDLRTVKHLKGIRARGRFSLHREDGKLVDREDGEIQFTDYGISGIAVMQMSGDAIQLCKKETPFVSIDFCPDLPDTALLDYLRDGSFQRPDLPATELLIGIVSRRIAREILRRAGVSAELRSSELSLDQLAVIAERTKQFRLSVTGGRGFKDAQVTRGGVPAEELKEGTLESRKVPGLYFAGEILDVDGMCGGFNLHFAWGSGLLAGRQMTGKENA